MERGRAAPRAAMWLLTAFSGRILICLPLLARVTASGHQVQSLVGGIRKLLFNGVYCSTYHSFKRQHFKERRWRRRAEFRFERTFWALFETFDSMLYFKGQSVCCVPAQSGAVEANVWLATATLSVPKWGRKPVVSTASQWLLNLAAAFKAFYISQWHTCENTIHTCVYMYTYTASNKFVHTSWALYFAFMTVDVLTEGIETVCKRTWNYVGNNKSLFIF